MNEYSKDQVEKRSERYRMKKIINRDKTEMSVKYSIEANEEKNEGRTYNFLRN